MRTGCCTNRHNLWRWLLVPPRTAAAREAKVQAFIGLYNYCRRDQFGTCQINVLFELSGHGSERKQYINLVMKRILDQRVLFSLQLSVSGRERNKNLQLDTRDSPETQT